MSVRLHEIELGAKDVEKSKAFYRSILGISLNIDQPGLKVFTFAANNIDFNLSNHFASNTTCISFLADNLEEIIGRLNEHNIEFQGPSDSHLGMKTIVFKDPDGFIVKVNSATEASPSWLK